MMMYRPPENTNRVKSIRSKFENDENLSENQRTPELMRQFSDPNRKNNIKRTPAFRIDRTNNERNSNKPSIKNHLYDNTPIINTNYKTEKPKMMKSKSNLDFIYIRSKFDQTTSKEEPQKSIPVYTEPIPKALRTPTSQRINPTNLQTDIYNASTVKLTDNGLTDTLKVALKKPLPSGPAPKKPPRTFQHGSATAALIENRSFLHQKLSDDLNTPEKMAPNTMTPVKKDPRYMLKCLEAAVRKSQIRKKRPDISTSGEDSDDSVLFKSKGQFVEQPPPPPPTFPPPKLPLSSQDPPKLSDKTMDAFNFNCFSSAYARVQPPTSCFFVDFEKEPLLDGNEDNDEPLYDIPYLGEAKFVEDKSAPKRNSLYYMSTALLGEEREKRLKIPDKSEKNKLLSLEQNMTTNQKIDSPENSSISSFSSDSELLDEPVRRTKDSSIHSNLPAEDVEASRKVKKIIETFETHNNKDDPVDSVTDLRNSLVKTLDLCFAPLAINSESDNDEYRQSVEKLTNRFQSYIKTIPKCKMQKDNNDALFNCCFIVQWSSIKPEIKFVFPESASVPPNIENLCYPEAASGGGPMDRSSNAQCYTIVITNEMGERLFGYCRRVIPEGSNSCLPLTYCILSKHRAIQFYRKILKEIENRHGLPNRERSELVKKFYMTRFPKPGESIRINLKEFEGEILETLTNESKRKSSSIDSLDLNSYVHVNRQSGEYGTLSKDRISGDRFAQTWDNVTLSQNGKNDHYPNITARKGDKTELILTLHLNARYEEADLRPLHKLPLDIVWKVFASLLLERKVIFVSCLMSELSSCVDALQSIIYPFTWPHTFIPILPECLVDVVQAPTPLICGILSVTVINKYPNMDHAIVIDLDSREILSEVGDEKKILSKSMRKTWEQALEEAKKFSVDDDNYSMHLSEAYTKVFKLCFKSYKTFMVDGVFQREKFVNNGKTKGIRTFLKWFTETLLFQSFLETIISDPNSYDKFD